jgi:hypothetical protein
MSHEPDAVRLLVCRLLAHQALPRSDELVRQLLVDAPFREAVEGALRQVGLELAENVFADFVSVRVVHELETPVFEDGQGNYWSNNVGLSAGAMGLLTIVWSLLILPKRQRQQEHAGSIPHPGPLPVGEGRGKSPLPEAGGKDESPLPEAGGKDESPLPAGEENHGNLLPAGEEKTGNPLLVGVGKLSRGFLPSGEKGSPTEAVAPQSNGLKHVPALRQRRGQAEITIERKTLEANFGHLFGSQIRFYGYLNELKRRGFIRERLGKITEGPLLDVLVDYGTLAPRVIEGALSRVLAARFDQNNSDE